MDIDRASADHCRIAPDLGEQLLTAEDASRMRHEVCEEIELRCGEGDRHAIRGDATGDLIKLDGTHRHRPLGRIRPCRPSDDRLHPGDDLTGAERLGDVVIGAEFKTEHSIDFVVASGAEQDWSPVAVRAKLAAHLGAVHAGQAYIEDDRHRVERSGKGQAARPIGCHVDPEALTGQVHPKQIGDRPLILDDEDETFALIGSGRVCVGRRIHHVHSVP